MTVAEAFRRNLPGPLLIAGRLTFAPVRCNGYGRRYSVRDWHTGEAIRVHGNREALPAPSLPLPL